MLIAVYLIYVLVVLAFLALATYAIYRVFHMPHPYWESRIVAVLFAGLSLVLLGWSYYLLRSINWDQLI